MWQRCAVRAACVARGSGTVQYRSSAKREGLHAVLGVVLQCPNGTVGQEKREQKFVLTLCLHGFANGGVRYEYCRTDAC